MRSSFNETNENTNLNSEGKRLTEAAAERFSIKEDVIKNFWKFMGTHLC